MKQCSIDLYYELVSNQVSYKTNSLLFHAKGYLFNDAILEHR